MFRKTPLSGPVLLLLLVAWHFVQPPAGQAQAAAPQLPPAAAATVDYEKDVKPLLSQNCYSCHGANAQQSGLRLDLRQNALRGGDYGPVILPGKSADSKLIRRLVDGDGGLQMPPSGPLSTEDIGILRAWIDQGAEFRTDIADEAPPKPIDPKLAAAIAAVRSERRAVVEKLLAVTPAIVKATDPDGATLLHHAAGFGRLDTMMWLLDAGADVNAKTLRGATPLHWAIHDEAKVRLLLTRGAVVNAKQFDGRTPLLLAASLGNGNTTLRLLLEHGADPSIATMNGQTPLMAAAIRGDVEAIGLLDREERQREREKRRRRDGADAGRDRWQSEGRRAAARSRGRRAGADQAQRDGARQRQHERQRANGPRCCSIAAPRSTCRTSAASRR